MFSSLDVFLGLLIPLDSSVFRIRFAPNNSCLEACALGKGWISEIPLDRFEILAGSFPNGLLSVFGSLFLDLWYFPFHFSNLRIFLKSQLARIDEISCESGFSRYVERKLDRSGFPHFLLGPLCLAFGRIPFPVLEKMAMENIDTPMHLDPAAVGFTPAAVQPSLGLFQFLF